MPQLRLQLPVLILHGPRPLVLAQPLMFPELSIAGESVPQAIARLGPRLRRQIEKQLSPIELAHRRAAPVELLQHPLQLLPHREDIGWRHPLTCTFDVARWQQGDQLFAYYVPALTLTVLVGRSDDAQQVLDTQIRAELFRGGIRSLAQLSRFDCLSHPPMQLSVKQLTANLLTPREQQRRSESDAHSATTTLRRVATRLRRSELQPAYHCRRSLARLAECLSLPARRSALLVGPSGVGKTAIVHQLVRSLQRFDLQHPFWSTEGTRLVSGQCGFGMWQAQCLQLAKEAQATDAVVHLGNLVELSESGRIGGSGGIGSFLAGRISDGSLLAVAECTAEQLTLIGRREPKLAAAFEIIHVSPPSSDETRHILAAAAQQPLISANRSPRRRHQKTQTNPKNKKSQSPQHLSDAQPSKTPPANGSPQTSALATPTPVADGALELLDRLHRRFPTDAAAPGRQLRFLQQVRSELAADQPLTAPRIAAAFMRQTGLPSFLVDDQQRPDLDRIERQLAEQVMGQPHALQVLVDVVATLALGFSRGDRPLASLLLIGPTGVGKTESAKALARLIYSDESRMIRIDMSELSTPSAVSRLIGDVSKPEGLLTGAIRAQPFSLLLLDEFEKAHPAVFDLLLQVLGEGRLTDSKGRLADFRNCILMMTSNLGVESFRAQPLGLAQTDDQARYRHHFETEVRRFLRPEMYNRLDRIIAYDPLSPETIASIARAQLNEIRQRDGLQARDGVLQWDEATVQLLAAEGYQPSLGARPLARVIERRLVTPLAEALCNLPPDCGVRVDVTAENQQLQLNVQRQDHLPQRSDPNQNSQARIAIVKKWVAMRRRAQAMLRSPAFLRVANRRTQLRRELKRNLKTAATANRRRRLLGSALAASLREYEKRIQEVESLHQAVVDAETEVALAHYQGQPLDVPQQAQQLEFFRERMWEGLASLLSEQDLERQSLALFITGPNLRPLPPLLTAYRHFAKRHGWAFDAYVLLPLAMDKPLTADEFNGWNSSPLCALKPRPHRRQNSQSKSRSRTRTRRSSSSIKYPAAEETIFEAAQHVSLQPTVHVYGMRTPAALTDLPRGALGCAVRVKGRGARLLLESEQGIHTFRDPAGRSRQHDDVFLVEAHAGRVIDFDVSPELHRRQFPRDGYPRRQYNFNKKLVNDFQLDSVYQWDERQPFAELLETLIQQEADQRIWRQLD
ncbi:AAA family ATPase [Roseimaritima ulvae]|nr:AAA family ATPase [Roseimaritima ulvae]